MILFYGSHNIFSQHHQCEFQVNGKMFNCAEQFMMWKKAELFGDEIIAETLLRQDCPVKMKCLGRKVINFNQFIWEECRLAIIIEGNYHKFKQNTAYGDYLLSTRNNILAEASPYDKVYGIGLSDTDPIQDEE